MTRDVVAKHLEGIGDLVVTAPIKPGFIPAFDTVTYRTRLEITLEALFKMRATAREHSLVQPFPEVERQIQSLLDFRLFVVESAPNDMLYLTARFDRGWQPYMRLIWHPLGTFLDLIFCNCEGYVPATTNSFEAFAKWVADRQQSSDFFYSANAMTLGDASYLARLERLGREAPLSDTAACAVVADDPGAVASATFGSNIAASLALALEALVGLHRLSRYYPPQLPVPGGGYEPSPDGRFLQQAARAFLPGNWDTMLPPAVRDIYREQLDWLGPAAAPAAPVPTDKVPLVYRAADVQGGILTSYDRPGAPMTHGCLLLMQVRDGAAARRFLANFAADIQTEAAGAPADGIYVNLSMTASGLHNLGVPAGVCQRFPEEFRVGMEERAGLIGDVRGSHPRRWQLPARNWPPSNAAPLPPVEPSEIDIVIQLRTRAPDHQGHDVGADADHPLRARIAEIAAAEGLELLAVESMRRSTFDPQAITDHFGFADGISQPIVDDAASSQTADHVARGEVLRGYADNRGGGGRSATPLLDNGTFLVVRKLRQDREALNAFLAQQAGKTGVSEGRLVEKMLGRRRDGMPLLPSTGLNGFDYSSDGAGTTCPFQSHVRRANPRRSSFGRPTPRIMRRGLSYGPDAASPEPAERGIMFMAYGASIAEQYEVIQRWINGGNATDVASCQGDPMLGVAEAGNPRTFRFDNDGTAVRIDIPQPFATLQWGIYLFVPSIAAIETIASGRHDDAEGPAVEPPVPDTGDAGRGAQLIARLRALETDVVAPQAVGAAGCSTEPSPAAKAWKACLEDFNSKDPGQRGDALDAWAAIRQHNGGVMRVPYPSIAGETDRPDAVLVADRHMAMQVFEDPERLYTMCEHQARLAKSIGPIYLGLDAGKEYDDQATVPNAELMKVTVEQAFDVASPLANGVLDSIFDTFDATLGKRVGKLDLHAKYITPVLALLCHHWVGIPDGPMTVPGDGVAPAAPEYFVAGGGWDNGDPALRKPRCPGDFMAPSRFVFYPDPEPVVQRYGIDQGRRLRAEVTKLFAVQRPAPTARLMPPLFAEFPNDDQLARTMVGVLVGFLPPTDANLRYALYEWIEEKTLWRIQDALAKATGSPFERARSALEWPLVDAMQKRPAPDLLWRIATRDHRIGDEHVRAGDRVIVGVSSATAADRAAGINSAYPIFGGNRDAARHGTHACPAYKFAMGTMLAILAALLSRGRIEAEPSPLIVKLADLPRPAGRQCGRG